MKTGSRTVGLINPGAMGTPVGVAARLTGAHVRWVFTGRSEASLRRAEAAEFEAVESYGELIDGADLVLSVCPPHAAMEVATEVAQLGFSGVFVDANAVSPDTARSIGKRVAEAGATFVDGSIIGGPPKQRGTTRLYLSGEHAKYVESALAHGHFDLVVLGEQIGAASAIKMAYAAWTKGSDALLLAIRALARSRGVEEALIAEWNQSQPGLAASSVAAVGGSVPKAWRFVGEMEQIAETFADTGLPDGFHVAATEVYRRLEPFKNAENPALEAVFSAIAGPPASGQR